MFLKPFRVSETVPCFQAVSIFPKPLDVSKPFDFSEAVQMNRAPPARLIRLLRSAHLETLAQIRSRPRAGSRISESASLKLVRGSFGLVSVMLYVQFGCLFGMMTRMMGMPAGGVRVVRRRLVIAVFVVLCRFAVMLRRMVVVLSCVMMMLRCFFRHFGLQIDVPACYFGH
jgi:hypothetical protein